MAAALEGPGASGIRSGHDRALRVEERARRLEGDRKPSWTIISGQESDWYISPIDGKVSAGAPLLLFRPAGDFVLTARVHGGLQDAVGRRLPDGVRRRHDLGQVRARDLGLPGAYGRHGGDTRGLGRLQLHADRGQLHPSAVVRKGPAIIFYASPDGHAWKLVRAFRLGTSPDLRVGFASQSPVGQTGQRDLLGDRL